MSERKITATIVENSESLYSVDVEVNGHHFKGDEPESYGSKNLGPAPYDLLLAALGECTAMTVRWYAIHQKWPLTKVSVSLTHEKKDRKDYFTKTLNIEGNGLSSEQRQKLYEIAAKCPVHRTLTSEVVIETF